MWDESTYQFPNFNGQTVEVSEWISNFIPYFLGLKLNDVIKKGSWRQSDDKIRLPHIDGLVQGCDNSSALAMELLQSCTKPSIQRGHLSYICFRFGKNKITCVWALSMRHWLARFSRSICHLMYQYLFQRPLDKYCCYFMTVYRPNVTVWVVTLLCRTQTENIWSYKYIPIHSKASTTVSDIPTAVFS